MGKLLNIDAETGADIIDDGTGPTLKIINSSGAALEVSSFIASSSATISGANLVALGSLDVDTPILAANASIIGVDIRGASVASGAILKFSGDAFVSCTSINFTTAAIAGLGAIRVVRSDGSLGWIPVMPNAAVDAAAV